MQRLLLFVLIVFARFTCFAQITSQNYPQTLHINADSFFVRFSNYSKLILLHFGKRDTVDMGTDASPGLTATIYYDKDSLLIPYQNLPYAQVHYIPIQSPKRKIIYRLHFNEITASFPPSYIEENKGTVKIEIPEVYELANIIWTLSPTGQRATDLNKEGAYYEKMREWFTPFLNHPLFAKLDFADSVYFTKYYDFRENSFCYNFNKDKLVYEGPYFYVMGDDDDAYNSLFKQLLPLVQDFADRSKFREFYANNKDLYTKQIQRQKERMPVRSMWNWLEQQFPKTKFQSYKVVFSPLIGGSHSTQNFSSFYNNELFRECVMFVCGTDRYDKKPELTEKQKEGLMSGIVFTEIDHNYVNPVSNRYREKIDSIFSNRNIWTSNGGDNSWYGSPMSVFNEYMTHAAFCLWVMDSYDKPTADLVINNRESLMVDKRHFSRFKEFDRALIEIRGKDKDTKLVDLFPAILDWCKTQN